MAGGASMALPDFEKHMGELVERFAADDIMSNRSKLLGATHTVARAVSRELRSITAAISLDESPINQRLTHSIHPLIH